MSMLGLSPSLQDEIHTWHHYEGQENMAGQEICKF